MRSSVGAVLVTGCSSGIGRATAELLARQGHTVYATARRERSLAGLKAAGCRTLSLDVTDEQSRKTAVDTVVSEAGAVGALVNNAGYSQSGALETLDLDDVRRQFETNVFGLLRMLGGRRSGCGPPLPRMSWSPSAGCCRRGCGTACCARSSRSRAARIPS